MRLLFFAYVNLDRPNACQTHTLGLLRGLAANGCQVDAVVPRPLGPLPRLAGVTFHYLPPHRGSRRSYLSAIPLSFLVLWRLCRRYRYQALYARDMDVFVGPRWCARLFGLPLYLEVDDAPVEGSYPPWLRRLVAANLRADYQRAAGLIVPSVPRCELLRWDFGVAPAKLHMVLNGDDVPLGRALSPGAARRRLGLPEECFVLGYVGSVNERYDFATMLTALAVDRMPSLPAHLVIVGDGSHLGRVKTLARDLGVADRVRCTGFVEPPALGQVMPAMEVGLMTLTAEAVRRHGPVHTKVATYGLFSLPVITAGYSLKGYPEALAAALMVVPPENPEALAAACLKLHRRPADRNRLGQALGDYVRAHLTWPQVARDILAVMAGGAPQPRWR